ncbi:MAG: class II glutamine amidotransferase [Archangium sp.]|nr:class II glutamine amidotransferase [Archangium sp.]
MCRIFAVRSNQPIAVESAFDGLRELAAEHKDGWGIARFEPGVEPHIEMRVDTAENCPRFIERGREYVQSLAVHIRLASVGTVHERNNHPFSAGKWVFMHNGTLKRFKTDEALRSRFDAEIDPSLRAFRGETDSERCFALFRTYLGGGNSDAEVRTALTRVFRFAEAQCDDATEGKRSAMNFLVTDGTRFFCTRRDRTLFATTSADVASIASEKLKLAGAEWREVPNDHLVTIDEQLKLSIEAIA